MNPVLLFLCLSPLFVEGWNIQESMRELMEILDTSDEHDIVFPRMLTGTHTRERRHATEGGQKNLHHMWEDNEGDIFYEKGFEDMTGVDDVTVIELKDWVLEMRQNPNLLVQEGVEAEWVSRGERVPVETHEDCILQVGTVRGVRDSIVAITTCDNSPLDNETGDMTGLIQIEGDSYFVQPLTPTGGLNRQHPHLVYRAKTCLAMDNDQDFGEDFTGTGLRNHDNGDNGVHGNGEGNSNHRNGDNGVHGNGEANGNHDNGDNGVHGNGEANGNHDNGDNGVHGNGEDNSNHSNYDFPWKQKRAKRESYWSHGVTQSRFFNLTDEEGGSSPDDTIDLYHVTEPEKSRAVIEHVRRKLQKEAEVGYFLDALWETEILQGSRRQQQGFSVAAPPRWLEFALAVDHTVIRFHGRERVQQYVLALMNIVSAIYKDPSLDSNLRLVIVQLIFFEDEHLSQVVEGNSKRSLENVNRWNEQLRGQHDVAVWLTRADLGGPSGYAPVSGACDPIRSCTLNRDEGLTSAFIIAHEMAHVLGLTHDGDLAAGNDCVREAVEGSVMAPMVSATFHRFQWSSCSKREFHIKAAQWSCLRNQPKASNATHLKSTLQATFSMDEQCRMEFGDGYSLCRSLNLPDPCSHLWCGHYSAPLVCKTKKGPPLEGTECGVNHWCVDGYCVLVDRRRFVFDPVTHNPRDGGWSEWSGWTPCSKSCGYGVSFRSRTCDNPRPAYGGDDCTGKSEEFHICGEVPCPMPLRDIRAQQCARLPSLVPIAGLGHRVNNTWLAHEAEPNSMKCQLTCVSRESGEVFMSGENLMDGTPCSYDSHDKSICIQGHCQTLGCDGVMDSPLQEDPCGVCGGDNSRCRNITTSFNRKLRRSMTRIAVFPYLARDVWINVTTVTEYDDLVKLVIRDRRSKQYSLAWKRKSSGPIPMYGTVTVWTVPSNKDTTATVVVEGAKFRYERKGSRERLTARGPLLAELVISVSADDSAVEKGITVVAHGGYTLHEAVLGADSRYVWQTGGWGPCSRSCGGGRRHKTVACRDRESGRLVARRHCSLVAKPPLTVEKCNVMSCDFVWVPAGWEECSSTCGSRGVQEREVFCVHNHTHDTEPSWRSMVDPERCRAGVKPEETRTCNRVPCPAHWVGGNWSQCSASCGRGYERMEFRCPAPRGEPYFDCGPSPPDEQRPCRGTFGRKHPICYKPKPCRRDASTYCSLTNLLGRYCVIPGFRRLCCKSCSLILNVLPE